MVVCYKHLQESTESIQHQKTGGCVKEGRWSITRRSTESYPGRNQIRPWRNDRHDKTDMLR